MSMDVRKATLALLVAWAATAQAQVSNSAYRALGQSNLNFNGLNMVQGTELLGPSGVALDGVHIYIADTSNSRILGWPNVNSYQIGDPPALVLGQPGPQYTTALGIGNTGLNTPVGLAVDPNTGNLYVADYADNRVVRFPAPFSNPSRIEPDAVYGQPNFTPSSSGVSASLLNHPVGLAFDSGGNLWVADTGNNRVVRFAASVLNSATPPSMDTVIGQKDFLSSQPDRGGSVSASGLNSPGGLAFDSQNNLYVADYNNKRVLRFTGPLSPANIGATAGAVWGQADFVSKAAPPPSAMTINGAAGIAVGAGNLYVSVPTDNRVMVFPLTPQFSPASTAFGQADFVTVTANSNVSPQASPNTLSSPADVKLDSSGNVYIADASNNRVVRIPAGARTANAVWGQSNFTSNGPNQVKPGSVNQPSGMAIDYSRSPFPLYVADTGNNRVLVWRDSVRFQSGDPADFAIGQPSLLTAAPNVDQPGGQTPSQSSLSAPVGVAVAADGSFYVSDSGNNRVLHYPRPVDQAGRVFPDIVLGQNNFTSSTSAFVSASSLKAPMGLALGPNGDLFVADSGNSRVLEFASGANSGSAAIRVYGQPNMNSSSRSSQVSPQTLSAPQGVVVDGAYNLFVADTGSNRVLIFPNTQSAPTMGMSASFVLGQNAFGSTAGGAGSGMRAPSAVGIDSNGNIYVADSGNNRVVMFQSLVFLAISGAAPSAVVGQQTLSGASPNWDSSNGLATADGLSGPNGLYIDRQNTLYVADAGNHRVVQFLMPAAALNAATYQVNAPVGRGGLVALFGTALAGNQATANQTPWPTAMANRQVVINDQLLSPLYYVGPGQINFQLPANSPVGTGRVAVTVQGTGELVAGGPILIAAGSPGLFTLTQNGTGQAAATNQDGSINGASNPVVRGSVLTLYGTGQGQVSPPVPDGYPAPSSPLSSTVAVPTSDGPTCAGTATAMCVAIGNLFGQIQFSGLAPNFVGLWQVNVQIPTTAPTGNAVPVRILINATASNIATVAIR